MNEQVQKRPTGMTILLVMSLINAIFWIVGSFSLYVTTPAMTRAVENGQIEQFLAPYASMLDETQMEDMMTGSRFMAQIDAKYWLFKLFLFVGSLFGVIKMFKGDKRGLHIYAISQILMLINSSVYFYPKQPQSAFVSDLLLTIIFILLYYLYFKRMEMSNDTTQSPNLP
jgi:hypothetical protein